MRKSSRLLRGDAAALLACGALLIALVARLWGIGHGLPFSYYPDEAHFVKRSLSFGSGDLNPHWFHKPAFFMYVLFFEYGVYYVAGRILGSWEAVGQFAVSFVADPGPFYLIGRLTVAAFSMGSVWLVYRIGRDHMGRPAGIAAAFFLALTLGVISAGQWVKADVPAMFFALASMSCALEYFAGGRRRHLILAAGLAGVGAGVKFYPAIFMLPVLVIIGWRWLDARRTERGALRKAVVATAISAFVFGATFFVSTPFSVLDPLGWDNSFGRVLRLVERTAGHLGLVELEAVTDATLGSSHGFFESLLHYGRVVFSTGGMGPVLGTIGVLGAFVSLVRWNRTCLIVLSAAAPFVVASVILYPGYAEPRHQVPVYPLLALTGGWVVVEAARSLGRRGAVLYAVVAVLLVVPAIAVARRAVEISREETRNAARSWIESEVPSGTKLVMDENGPRLVLAPEILAAETQAARAADPRGQFTAHYDAYLEYQLQHAAAYRPVYRFHEIRKAWWLAGEEEEGPRRLEGKHDRDMGNPLRLVGVKTYDTYVEEGYEYAVVHSDAYARFFKEDSPQAKLRPSFARFYRELFARGDLVKEFDAAKDDLTGPTVKVFRLRP